MRTDDSKLQYSSKHHRSFDERSGLMTYHLLVHSAHNPAQPNVHQLCRSLGPPAAQTVYTRRPIHPHTTVQANAYALPHGA
jgi:hypothetical protein